MFAFSGSFYKDSGFYGGSIQVRRVCTKFWWGGYGKKSNFRKEPPLAYVVESLAVRAETLALGLMELA